MDIKINKEFEQLIPPLSNDEYRGLEQNIIDNGCRDAIVLWNEIIVDGHNRYKICTKHNIKFETKTINFISNDNAKKWMILNQFARRNITNFVRAELALKLKPLIAEMAKDEGYKNRESNKSSCLTSDNIDTKKILAKKAGVGHDTIAKTEKIIKSAVPKVVELARDGEISVNAASKIAELPREIQEEVAEDVENGVSVAYTVKAHVHVSQGNNEWYTPQNHIDSARLVMGCIDVDPASSDIAQILVNAETHYTKENSGLDKDWKGSVWLNPPYSHPEVEQFTSMLVDQFLNGNVTSAIVLVNNATDTKWFHELLNNCNSICIPKGRVNFTDITGTKTLAARQGQFIFYFGDNSDGFNDEYSQYGKVFLT